MSNSDDIKKTAAILLNAPYPFEHEHYKRIYEKCGLLGGMDLYTCNYCKIKVLGDKRLLDHNKSFDHQTEMEKQITEMLKKSDSNKKMEPIKFSKATLELFAKAAIQTSKIKLNEAMAELKNEYELYRLFPWLHPMYAKEWQVFYLRRLSDFLANNCNPNLHDFTRDWSAYWVQRIQVYYNKALQNVIENISINYKSTLCENGIVKPHSERQINDEQTVRHAIDNDVMEIEPCIIIAESSSSDCNIVSQSESQMLAYHSESECEDALTTKLRDDMPAYFRNELIELAQNSRPATINENVPKNPFESTKENNIQIDEEAIADAVVSFFNACGLNTSNLSDEQVKNYIKYVAKKSTKSAKQSAGFVKTLS